LASSSATKKKSFITLTTDVRTSAHDQLRLHPEPGEGRLHPGNEIRLLTKHFLVGHVPVREREVPPDKISFEIAAAFFLLTNNAKTLKRYFLKSVF
jgi:hypothetical protein